MSTKAGLSLFGHPVHPMLVHLPMGLLLTAPLWDLIGLVRPSGAAISAVVGEWTLAVGCLGGLAAAVAGMVDFGALPEGHPAARAANFHLYLVLGALALFGTSLLVRHGHGAAGVTPTLLGLDVAGVLCLAAGGYFGAEMVYRHGVGRRSAATEPHGSGYHQTEQ
jgi:uncharacterized membrane protein